MYADSGAVCALPDHVRVAARRAAEAEGPGAIIASLGAITTETMAACWCWAAMARRAASMRKAIIRPVPAWATMSTTSYWFDDWPMTCHGQPGVRRRQQLRRRGQRLGAPRFPGPVERRKPRSSSIPVLSQPNGRRVDVQARRWAGGRPKTWPRWAPQWWQRPRCGPGEKAAIDGADAVAPGRGPEAGPAAAGVEL